MKKILFLIPHLDGGGAEKILLDTLKNIDPNMFNVELKCLFNKGVWLDQIPNYVKYTYVFPWFKKNHIISTVLYSVMLRVLKIIPAKLLYLLAIKEKYDVEIAYLEGVSTKVISGSHRDSKKISWVHIDPKVCHYSKKAFVSMESERRAYLKFDRICCVSSDVKKSLDHIYHLDSRTIIQFNVLDEELVLNKSLETIENFTFKNSNLNVISVGRLSDQKNYLSLLEVVKKLKDSQKYINLYILGEGEQKTVLQDYIEQNDLSDSVKLLGFKKNPYPYVKACDLFVCSSKTEGFSTVVTEAIVLNLPVLTTNCAGMEDIIADSACGLIVPNSTQGLYEGFVKLLNDKLLLENMKKNTKNRACFFSKKKRIEELYELIN